MRMMGWRVSSLRSVRACGRAVLPHAKGADGNAHVRTYLRGDNTLGVSIGGLCSCGSRNCARCAGVIARQRAIQLAEGLDWWLNTPWADGQSVGYERCALFLTLTVRHGLEDSASDLINAVSRARTALTAGTAYRGGPRFAGDRQRYGIAGWCHTIENTWNPVNGHHIHLHSIILLARIPTVEEYIALGKRLFGRWAGSLAKSGYDCDMNHGGFNMELISDGRTASGRLAEYVTKDTAEHAAFELLNGRGKHGRSQSMTYFGMQAMIAQDPACRRFWFSLPKECTTQWADERTLMVINTQTGEIVDERRINNPNLRLLRVTHEIEQALKGRRMVTYSYRCRKPDNPLDMAWNEFLDRANPDRRTDEQLANARDDFGTEVMRIRAGEWYERYVRYPERIIALLDRVRTEND